MKLLNIKSKTSLMDFSTYLMAFGFSLVMFITFLFAYFQGYSIRVMVNNYGEAHIEFILLVFVMMPVLVYGLFVRCKELKKINKNVMR